MNKQTFGVIVTSRDFFPSHLAVEARKEILHKLDSMGYGAVIVGEKDTRNGAIVSYEEARICAQLFKEKREEISGIIVVLPNFGEETGVTEAIQLAGLNVPVLIQACDDDFDNLALANRRDAFCGKLSVCNNLYQRDIPYTTTTLHTCKIASEEFAQDLRKFAGVCRVVKGIRGARIAAIGTRPNAFNTVRYSEKLLQKMGVSVCTIGMADVIDAAKNMDDNAVDVQEKVREIYGYGKVEDSATEEKVLRQAKLCIALENTVKELHCDASAVECWDAVENHYGCATCLGMSMMGEKGMPSACEMDVMGAVTMLAVSLAAETPAAYMDWNNNVDNERDMCVNLHCSNFPKSFFGENSVKMEIGSLDVLATTLGTEKCFGACKAQVSEGPFTFAKVTTDDKNGMVKMYIGTGEFGSRTIETKGGLALCQIDGLQNLMRHLCNNGYEHHVAMGRGHVADVLEEAFGNYLGVDVYHHHG